MASQLTLRFDDPALGLRLKQLAQERGESVNTLAVSILARAVGLDHRRDELAALATWTETDGADFDQVLAEQRRIDAGIWR